MSLVTGLDAQLGFAVETTYGTFTVPNRFIEFNSESFALEIERIESSAIRKGIRVMRSEDWKPGQKKVSGEVELELWNKGQGIIFEHIMGGTATSGPSGGVYTHTFTPNDNLPSFTVQAGIPQMDFATPSVVPFTYTGCVVESWELSASVGDPVMLKVSFVGQDEALDEDLATASYASSPELLTFVGASLSLAGSSFAVHEVTVSGDNGLNADRYFLGSQLMSQPAEAALRTYEGSLSADFTSTTAYQRFVNGTEAALVATFAGVANPTHHLKVTANVRFDGETPQVGDTDIVAQSLPFKCVASSDDASAITLEYKTPDSTP